MNSNNDSDFERILDESFNHSYNNNINIPISTSEANNVNDIFVGNEVKTECIICYEENIACIKCFKCTAVYCKICLTKIASESNKCICASEIRANYSKLKKYNQDLIKKSREIKAKREREIQNHNNRNNAITTATSSIDTNNTNTNNTNTNNSNTNTYTRNIRNILSNTTNTTNTTSNASTTDHNLALKLAFLKDLGDNKIYNIDFKSFCNKHGSSNNTPNFDYLWDYNNKTLTFYAVPNTTNELKNIVFNYNTLNAENQGEIYVWILNLLILPYNEFKTKWNKIATIMPQITDINKTIMIRNIVDICRN
jgi:hypothetical protein